MTGSLEVRRVEPDDAARWLRLRAALWPNHGLKEHAAEIDRFFAGDASEPAAVLLAVDSTGAVLGLAELSVRPFAEGCSSSQIAYLEGWFVIPTARRRGVGRALVSAAEEWGRARGCSEFASDTEPENMVGIAAHRALGFSEVGSILCFRKVLRP